MANEVAVQKELNFSVDFKKSEITVANQEEFENAIKAYADKYNNLIIDPNNITDAKNVRSEMNTVKKGLDNKRKEIKKEFNEPLTLFEKWVKNQINEIQKVIIPIDEGIKSLEEVERQNRKKIIEQLVHEMSETHNVSFEDVSVSDSWWEPAGSFTKTNKPTKKTIESISFTLNQIAGKQKQLESDIAVIANYAKAVGLEQESWTIQVKNGLTPAQLIKMMDEAIREKNANKEYEEAMANLEKEKTETTENGIEFDSETGEVLSNNLFENELLFEKDEDPFPVIKEKNQTMTIKMTGPNHLLLQVRQYILGLGIEIKDGD